MKKFLAIILSIITCFSLCAFVGCVKPQESGEKQTYTFYAPDGAPALAIAQFIKDGQAFSLNADFDYKVVSSSDIGGVMSKGDGDFIIMPINAASKLYKANATDPYKMVSVVTHGNLYVMSSDGTDSLESLKGKVIGVIGQGLVPDLTLRAVLKDKGLISDVIESETAVDGKIAVRYFASAQDMLPMLKTGKLSVGLIPEPAATKLTKIAPEKTWTRLDLQEIYDSETKAYPQAVLMVKTSVLNQNANLAQAIENKFNENVTWVKENVSDAVTAINAKLPKGVTPSLDASALSAPIIDNCKIYWQSASDAKADATAYINKIISVKANSALALSDDFFA